MTHSTHFGAFFSFALGLWLSGCNSNGMMYSIEADPAVVLPEYDLGVSGDLGEDVAISGEVSAYLSVATAKSNGLATSPVCAECHANSSSSSAMKDAAGRNIAPFDLWQSTMKANAARDPFFRAVMSAESYRHPEASDVIEATYLRCHSPAGAVAAERMGTTISLANSTTAGEIGDMASDGVNCVACHAITDVGLGTMESYSAGWILDTSDRMFGPHKNPFTMPMKNRSGFTPTSSDHMMESELCATCHTLFTATFLEDGTIAEKPFPEQTPYLEWKNSDFAIGATAQSCQDCHMPTVDQDGIAINTRIAHKPDGTDFGQIDSRNPYGRHLLVGGNIWVPQIFQKHRDTLGPQATDAAFDATIVATIDQLQNRTAELTLANAVMAPGSASFDVKVENLTGHKFPSGYPSRRAWIRVRIFDGANRVLWESGGFDDAGDITGEKTGEPRLHRTSVESADDIQIYEGVLGDEHSASTVALLHADQYFKDNRLLPKGWRSDHEDIEHMRPVGTEGDSDFVGGSDTTAYAATFEGTPAKIEVSLHYQALGNRWIRELLRVPTADVQAFGGMWSSIDRRPVTISAATFP